MIDETTNPTSNDPERVGFCQDCGKPLTRDTARPVGSGVFCEPCLEARLGTVPPPYGGAATPPPPPTGGYREPFPPMGGNSPSPGLAAVLGIIPGVGAMYNGQFAKGIVHIAIYAVLQSLAGGNNFFGFLAASWVIYQMFEAYHTAKARREGLPLPDPFGLNNIGAQVGAHFRGTTAPNSPNAAWTQPNATVPPVDPAAPPQAWAGTPVPPPTSAYTQPAWDTPAWTPPPANPAAPYSPVMAPDTFVPVRSSRLPGAAIWLIGFGVLFLLLNLVPDLRFSIHKIFPFLLMALGIGIFARRMDATGGFAPRADEGDAYTSRAICSLRAPVILFTVGLLWMLQEFDVIYFHKSWPVIVIVIGVLLLIERSLGTRNYPPAPFSPTATAPDANDGKGL